MQHPRKAARLFALSLLLPCNALGQDVEPIAQVRIDRDGDHVPDRVGDTVSVAGRAPVGSGELHASELRAFVQDGYAGIALYDRTIDAEIQRGDSVVVTGIVAHYNGTTQIQVSSYHVVPSTRRAPSPVEISDPEDLESHEGTLVRLRGEVVNAGENRGGRYLVIESADGAFIQLFVSSLATAPIDLEAFPIHEAIAVTGILGQYDREPPYDSSYQIYPRSRSDIVSLGSTAEPSRAWWIACALLGLGVLAAAIALLCIVITRGRRYRRAERKLEAIYDASPTTIVILDRDQRVREANPAAAKLFHLSQEDLVEMTVADLFDSETADIEQALAPSGWGELVTFEARRADALGENRRDLFVEARRFELGDETGLLLMVHDMTETRESERVLRASEQRLRMLTKQMPAVLWTVDEELRFTSITGAGLREMELTPETVIGLTTTELLGPDHIGVEMHARAIAGDSPNYEAEFDDRFYQVHLEPFHDVHGEIVGVIGIALDITNRRRMEQQLEDQTAYLTQLFEESPEAIALLDDEDRVLRVNHEFTRMFGYASGEALHHTINELVVPDHLAGEASGLSQKVATGQKIHTETVRRRKDGSTLDVSILGAPIDVEDGRHIYGIYRDVSEQKRLEDQLLQSQKLEAVGRLAGGVAHDFNNLLTAILGHTALLEEKLCGDEDVQEDLTQIGCSARRGAELTRQLLTFSRKDENRVRPLDLNDVVATMEKLLCRLVSEKIEIVTELSPEIPAIEGDPTRIEQVVMNLAINASDAMDSGGRLTIETDLVQPGDPGVPPEIEKPAVLLAVSDTGTGMTSEEQARMFEPFYTSKPTGQGTGLGLAIVYGIVEGMEGTIDVDSAPDAGTRMRVYFPVSTGRAALEEQASSVESPAPADTHRTILLVEDESSIRTMLQRLLEGQGYTVFVASDAEQALSILESKGPDSVELLVSDMVMPGMSGHELGARVRRMAPTIQAVFISGYTEIRDLPEEFDDGDAQFLSKPFSAQTFIRTVREMLAR